MSDKTTPTEIPTELKLTRLAALLGEAEADAAALYEAKQTGQARGPVTGLRSLDREIGSALLPGVHILHGKPGSGKTALAWQIAATCGCPALFVTCEMRPLVLLKRLAARVTGTYLGRFSTGEFTPDQAMGLYTRSVADAPYLALLDATESAATIADIEAAAKTTLRQTPDKRYLLLVLDSLHTFADSMAVDSTEYDRLNAAIGSLRSLSARLNCPVLAIAERNRANMSGGLSAGAGSRKIEYGAETVLDLDAKDDEGHKTEKSVTLKLSKNRNGAGGKTIRLLFHGATQKLTEDAQ
jgi:replicative DNA helicase